MIKLLLIIKNNLFSMKIQPTIPPPKNETKKCKCDKNCGRCKVTKEVELQTLTQPTK
jgi:hypothetical protein